MSAERIVVLEHGDAAETVDTLCAAFRDYPVMRWVLGSKDHFESRLETLIHLFVMARILRGEFLFGIGEGARLEAVALVSRPDGLPSPSAYRDLRERLWRELGSGSRVRYDAFGAACAPFQVEGPHLHLNMIGVRPDAQGRGLGHALLEHVHDLSSSDPASSGVSLTTEDERNVPLYQRFGYRIVGRAKVSSEVTTWGFFRPDDPTVRPAPSEEPEDLNERGGTAAHGPPS